MEDVKGLTKVLCTPWGDREGTGPLPLSLGWLPPIAQPCLGFHPSSLTPHLGFSPPASDTSLGPEPSSQGQTRVAEVCSTVLSRLEPQG